MTITPYIVPAAAAPARVTWVEAMDRGLELAEVIANTEFVPKGLRGNQPAILAAILYGHEVGLEPMQSLRSIAVIDGRPTMSAEVQRALILRHGHDLTLEESTNTRAVWAGRRRDSKTTQRVTWTLDDAKKAQIAGKANWQRYPRQMLSARASAELARAVFADVIGGMAATEELEDLADEAGAPMAIEPTLPPSAPSTRRRRRPSTSPEGSSAPSPPAPVPAPESPKPQPEPEPEQPAEPPPPRPPVEPEPGPEPTPANPDDPPTQQMRLLFALFNEKGMGDRETRLSWSQNALGRNISSSTELSAVDVSRLIEQLRALPDVDPTEPGPLPANEQAVVDELERELARPPTSFEPPPSIQTRMDERPDGN